MFLLRISNCQGSDLALASTGREQKAAALSIMSGQAPTPKVEQGVEEGLLLEETLE